jgi:hypothetical protein
MTPGALSGLWWLLLTLVPLLFLQRRLHWEIQAIFLLLTRRVDVAITLFAVLFFPGVLLHESSHFLMARLLGVRTGRFSLLPRPLGDGRLQLGFVETAPTDWVRDTLIGAAPLIAGGLFVAYAGLKKLGLLELWQAVRLGDLSTAFENPLQLAAQPDFWLWLYLTLVVSSTMLPSAADRRSWLPLGATLAMILALSWLVGAGPWMAENLAAPFNLILLSIAVVFGVSVVVHSLLVVPAWALRRLLCWLLNLEVVL